MCPSLSKKSAHRFPHDISDYVNAGLRAGLALLELGERRDARAEYRDPPRIVSAHFRA
jgi:hypothetical protein